MKSRFCPICYSNQKTPLYEQHFHNTEISLMDKYVVVVCETCCFGYADCIPSQEAFDRYYETMSKYEITRTGSKVSQDHLLHFEKIVDFLEPHIPSMNSKILDVGCATGALLAVFKDRGYRNLYGIDPSPSCVRTAKDLYGIEAEACHIMSFDSDDKYDLIILSAVLEHLVNIRHAVAKLRSLLSPTGLLFVEVPDAQRFHHFVSAPFQQFSIEHINYFSRVSLENLFNTTSLELIQSLQSEAVFQKLTDPDLFFLLRATHKPSLIVNRDLITKQALLDYVAVSARKEHKVVRRLKSKLSSYQKVIVWGVGTHTQRLIGTVLNSSKVLYFVDSNPRYVGKKLKTKHIRSPKDIIEEDIPILVSTFLYQEEIISQIRATLNLKNPIITLY